MIVSDGEWFKKKDWSIVCSNKLICVVQYDFDEYLIRNTVIVIDVLLFFCMKNLCESLAETTKVSISIKK
jgi:hypothetical protein